MKKNLTPLLLFFSIHCFSIDPVFHPDSAYRHSINFSSGYYFASNAITNKFASYYFLAKFIDNDLKDDVSRKLKNLNRLGAEFKTNLSYTSQNDTVFGLSHSWWSAGISNNYHIDARFKKDVFELYFRGNKQYAGKSADLGKFIYNQQYWQQVNFTFGHEYRRDLKRFGYSAGLSIIKGQKFYHIQSDRATLFTESMGAYLDLDADLEIRQSDSAQIKATSWNGTGASVNGSFYLIDKNKNVLKFIVEDGGIIQWNRKSAFIKADTAFRFEGIDVSDLFTFADTVHEKISVDSSLVQPYLNSRKKESFLSPLPSLLRLSYTYILTPGKTDIEGRVSYLLFGHSDLQESLCFSYTIKEKHRLSLLVHYGGYSGFRAGIAYKGWIANRVLISAGSDYISSMLDNKNGTGQGAFVSLSTYF